MAALVILVVVVSALLIPTYLSATYRVCQHYGGCTICDFFGEDGSYQGYIEWCF